MLKMGRRYPDDMPTYKKLRDDLIARAVGLGVEIAAAGPLDTDSKFGQAVLKQAPGMKTILAFAFQIPEEVAGLQQVDSYQATPYQYALYHNMHSHRHHHRQNPGERRLPCGRLIPALFRAKIRAA